MVGESRVLMGGRGEGGQGMMGMCLTVSHWLIPQKEKKKKPKPEFFTDCIIWTEYNLPNYTSITDTVFLYFL